MKRVIAISGKLGSGKDTAAQFLAESGYTSIAFADPLKRFLAEVYGFSEEQLWGPSEKRVEASMVPYSGVCAGCHKKCRFQHTSTGTRYWCRRCKRTYPVYLDARTALQTLGTEWGRTMHEGTWTDYLIRKIDESLDRYFVITDLRFVEEFNAVVNKGQMGWDLTTIRIRREEPSQFRPGILKRATDTVRDLLTKDHRSESEMDSIPDTDFDYVIYNTGTLEALRSAVNICSAGSSVPGTALYCRDDTVTFQVRPFEQRSVNFTLPSD